ncbi:YVTN repeat-like/Quino protein amine dehydrogenase [Lophium mytilinum]|uniref:YVTN repeat-like/Quino protein amine dehydrogenase n=1 Tax=Lophium mytilinum TaxID=390894 RepID=A0A6A6QS95_9PEZI|nr:YVTN repeat-like/Quino protein amine dehydrogenase [Lophium mytilinum]
MRHDLLRKAADTVRGQFLAGWSFAIDPNHDFRIANESADWASGHPFTWDCCPSSRTISVPLGDDAGHYHSMYSAVSGDEALFAVSAGKKIYVYDLESKELRQTLDGCGNVFFRPIDRRGEDISETELESSPEDETLNGGPKYTLICSVPSSGRYAEGASLVIWDLDKNGRLLDEDEPLDAPALAAKALASISADLTTHHEWSSDFIGRSTLAADIETALKKAETEHHIAHNTIIPVARFVGGDPISPDGSRLLYLTSDASTPSDIRDVDDAPWIGVWDLNAGKELYRLHGHTDTITWAGFSPNGTRIATVSWDGTMRMHDAYTGSLTWVTEDSRGQCWTAAFSPDGKQIVWSSKNGGVIKVLDVETGGCNATFPQKLNHWARSLAWTADGCYIAIGTGSPSAYVWRPLETDGAVMEIKLKKEEGGRKFGSMADLNSVKWLDDAKLAVGCSDGSVVVWDRFSNAKEGFLKTQGQVTDGYTPLGIHFLKEKETYVNLDHDGKIRFWRHSVPAFPSWWEKGPAKPEKEAYPATGKYVKITKRATPKPSEPNSSEELPVVERLTQRVKLADSKKAPVDEWLEKGAELWTAE